MLSFRLRTMTKHVLKCETAGYYLFIIGYRAALTTLLEAVTARKVPAEAEAADPASAVTPPQARGTLAVAEVEVHLPICCYRRSQNTQMLLNTLITISSSSRPFPPRTPYKIVTYFS